MSVVPHQGDTVSVDDSSRDKRFNAVVFRHKPTYESLEPRFAKHRVFWSHRNFGKVLVGTVHECIAESGNGAIDVSVARHCRRGAVDSRERSVIVTRGATMLDTGGRQDELSTMQRSYNLQRTTAPLITGAVLPVVKTTT